MNKSGIRIRAGMNQFGTACETPGDHAATVSIVSATVEDTNANGNLDVKACGDVSVDSGGGSQLKSAGAVVSLTCYEPFVNPATGQPCRITVDHATMFGNRIRLEAQGDVTLVCTEFQTIGPRDLHEIVSVHRSVPAVATINGGAQTVLGPCNAIDPASSCVGRGIDLVANPVRASAASRTLRAVINAANVRCDT